MLRRYLACGLLLTLSLASFGGDKPEAKLPPAATNAGLEKMKKLAGTWLTADKDGKPTDQVASVIKVTAGGSVVHETLFPGQPQEMVSIYTVEWAGLDHDALLRAGQSTTHEGRPELVDKPNRLPVRGRRQPRPDQGQAHARSDPHRRRRRSHRSEGHGLGKRRARQGYVLWVEARSEEIDWTSYWHQIIRAARRQEDRTRAARKRRCERRRHMRASLGMLCDHGEDYQYTREMQRCDS